VWALVQSHGDGHRSLVTPERVLSEYNEDLMNVLNSFFNFSQGVFIFIYFLKFSCYIILCQHLGPGEADMSLFLIFCCLF